jgi:hypothetical protein
MSRHSLPKLKPIVQSMADLSEDRGCRTPSPTAVGGGGSVSRSLPRCASYKIHAGMTNQAAEAPSTTRSSPITHKSLPAQQSRRTGALVKVFSVIGFSGLLR